MPICERDPWRFQFFKNVVCPDDINIPTDDPDCWEWYPDFRWIYDKQKIALGQGIACGLHDTPPTNFPVYCKPNINLKGMGTGGRSIHSRVEFEAHSTPDHMWMELCRGEHISTDCAIVAGKLNWCRHTSGIPWHENMFKHWILSVGPNPVLETYLGTWIEKNMRGYTGMMNFETIGGRIIEAHLRFADQWCDLYGRGWVEALVSLYATGVWSFKETPEPGFSIPLFAKHGGAYKHPTELQQAIILAMPHVKSLQITFHESMKSDLHSMPPGGFRLAIVNCTNLAAGLEARRALATYFPAEKIMLPE